MSVIRFYSTALFSTGCVIALLSPVRVFAEALTVSNENKFLATQKQNNTTDDGLSDRGYWIKDSARNVFGSSRQKAAPRKLEYFAPVPVVSEEEDDQAQAAPARVNHETNVQAQTSQSANTQQSQASAQENPNETARAKLLREYGDPNKEAPVTAVETAPKPFKAMMAALEAGDDQLAFKYARQHVRYMQKLQQRNTMVMGLTGHAMEREGLIGKGGWQNWSQFEDSKNLLESDLKEDQATNKNSKSVSIDDQARALLESQKAGDENPQGSKDQPVAFDEKTERARARSELTGKVPVEPGSRVDTYFFLKPFDANSQAMGKQLQQIYLDGVKKGPVNIVGFSDGPMTPAQERIFRDSTGATYPIVNGSKLIKLMDIQGAPSTAFVHVRSKKAYIINGVRNNYYIEELMKIMEGR